MKKRTRDRHVRSVFLQKILLVVFLMFSFSLSYATTEDSTTDTFVELSITDVINAAINSTG